MTALERRLTAAAELVTALREVEEGGSNLLAAFIGDEPFVAFQHYPEDDFWDPETCAQFYFHAHNPGTREAEVGHIHCFHRPGGRDSEAAPHHLVAIALDAVGRPCSLFTTNRWVTQETFLPAPAAREVALHYGPSGDDVPSRVVAAIFGLYREEIMTLLDERDAVLAARMAETPGSVPLEDHSLEIVSKRAVDLDVTLEELRQALPD